MKLPKDFITSLAFVPPEDIVGIMLGKDRRKTAAVRWIIKNEVRPIDFYCYFGGRFGKPNGIQNFLRNDDSDNFIHWEWFLRFGEGFLIIQGMAFRTEVWVSGVDADESDKDEFVTQLKKEFAKSGPLMSKVREALEHWVEFINPYQRLRRAVSSLMEELSSLGIDAKGDRLPDITDGEFEPAKWEPRWTEQAKKYSRALGLCFGVRSMLPVMAEAFVNLLFYALAKPELRKDERLFQNAIRQPIDIRIRALPHNCYGFSRPVDYANEACKRYHSLVNRRNDLLHGNVAIDNLRFNELYFYGKVPIFIEYLSMWERSLGVVHRSVGLDSVQDELSVVDGLIQYLLSCLADPVKREIDSMISRSHLGACLDDGRLGVLFPEWVVDFIPIIKEKESG